MGLQATVLDAVSVAKEALDDLAVDMTLISRDQKTYVPGSSVGYNEVPVSIKGVITKFREDEIDGQMIHRTDLLVVVFPPANKAIPKPNDVLKFGAREWRVVGNSPVYAGSEIALNLVQVRPPI